MGYRCPYCSYRCTSYRSHTRHVFESHSGIPNFAFTCEINGCIRKFQNYNTLKSHIARNHCGEDPDSAPTYLPSSSTLLSDSDTIEHVLNDEGPTSGPDSLQDCQLGPDIDSIYNSEQSQTMCMIQSPSAIAANQLQKSSALYLLTLKEKYKLTQTAIDFTVGQLKVTVDNIVDDLHQAVDREIMNTPGLSDDDKSRISSVFHNVKNPFSGLETQYLQSKYFEENFALVVSLFNIYINSNIFIC